jgi:hypothetical protein
MSSFVVPQMNDSPLFLFIQWPKTVNFRTLKKTLKRPGLTDRPSPIYWFRPNMCRSQREGESRIAHSCMAWERCRRRSPSVPQLRRHRPLPPLAGTTAWLCWILHQYSPGGGGGLGPWPRRGSEIDRAILVARQGGQAHQAVPGTVPGCHRGTLPVSSRRWCRRWEEADEMVLGGMQFISLESTTSMMPLAFWCRSSLSISIINCFRNLPSNKIK